METVFRVGQKVYDQVYEPDKEGEVLNIDTEIENYPITVKFGSCVRYYTAEGCKGKNTIKTLSTNPYTIQGFEQKAHAPTVKEALEWLRKNGGCDEFDHSYPEKENVFCFEALKKLVILREYYNEGWKADWKSSDKKYIIEFYEDEMGVIGVFGIRAVLHFRSRKIAERFLEEQKELLEIAKPLL